MELDNLELIFDFFEEDFSEYVVQGDVFFGYVGIVCFLLFIIVESGKSVGIFIFFYYEQKFLENNR